MEIGGDGSFVNQLAAIQYSITDSANGLHSVEPIKIPPKRSGRASKRTVRISALLGVGRHVEIYSTSRTAPSAPMARVRLMPNTGPSRILVAMPP